MVRKTLVTTLLAFSLAGGTVALAQSGSDGEAQRGMGMQQMHDEKRGGHHGMMGMRGGMMEMMERMHAPTLDLRLEGNDRKMHFRCGAEMAECLKALDRIESMMRARGREDDQEG